MSPGRSSSAAASGAMIDVIHSGAIEPLTEPYTTRIRSRSGGSALTIEEDAGVASDAAGAAAAWDGRGPAGAPLHAPVSSIKRSAGTATR